MEDTTAKERALLQHLLILKLVVFAKKGSIVHQVQPSTGIAHRDHIVDQLSCRRSQVNVQLVTIARYQLPNRCHQIWIKMVEQYAILDTIAHLVLQFKYHAQLVHIIPHKESLLRQIA
jgi:hypothetical protein